MLLAYAGLRGIMAVVPPNTIPDEAQIALNAPVLLFTLAVSVMVSLLFGLAPALQLAGRDMLTPLKEAGRGVSGGMRQRLMRGVLVVAEVALSLVLLVGASLMIRTLHLDPGGQSRVSSGPHPDAADSVLRAALPGRRTPQCVPAGRAAADAVGSRRDRRRGQRRVCLRFTTGASPVEAVGSAQQDTRPVLMQQINADYPRVMGITLLQGRFLTRSGGQRAHAQHRGEPDLRAAILLRRRGDRTDDPDSPPAHAAAESGRRFVPDRWRGERHGERVCHQRDLAGAVHAIHDHGPRGPNLRARRGPAGGAGSGVEGAGLRRGSGPAADGRKVHGDACWPKTPTRGRDSI